MNHSSKNDVWINSFLKYLAKSIADFVAPRHCIVCKNYIDISMSQFKFICGKCYDNMPFTDDSNIILNRFHAHFGKNSKISRACSLISLKDENDYLNIVYALKYNKFTDIVNDIGELLARRIVLESMDDFDLIVPIPIHKVKERERGFNQSDLIAYAISEYLNIPVRTDVIIRSKYTITQTVLDKNQREVNMKKVFTIPKISEIKDKKILIIDDVLTTGATINSAAAVLTSAGASETGCATLIAAGI